MVAIRDASYRGCMVAIRDANYRGCMVAIRDASNIFQSILVKGNILTFHVLKKNIDL